jgi:hypothetical protein
MPRARAPIIPITVCLYLKYNILLVHDKAKLFNSNEAKSVSGLRELIIDTKFSRQRVPKFNHTLRTGQSGSAEFRGRRAVARMQDTAILRVISYSPVVSTNGTPRN